MGGTCLVPKNRFPGVQSIQSAGVKQIAPATTQQVRVVRLPGLPSAIKRCYAIGLVIHHRYNIHSETVLMVRQTTPWCGCTCVHGLIFILLGRRTVSFNDGEFNTLNFNIDELTQ